MLLPVALPPGMSRSGTEYLARGRWYDGSLVRFYSGSIQPVGGWAKANSADVLTGRPCGIFAWRPNATDLTRFLSVGTHSNLYVYDGDDVYDITPVGFVPGRDEAIDGLGYGAGPYGEEDYGDIRAADGRVQAATTWSLDAWGEYLVACSSSDGKLYEWQLNTASDAAVITNAPVDCAGVLVTAERMMFALGADGDVRKVQWCTAEDNTTWTPTSTNTAGDLLLSSDGAIQAGVRTRDTNLVWTDVDLHSISYIGAPYFYSAQKIGDNCGLIGPLAKAQTETIVAWMSPSGFWVFDGYVKPLPCEVLDYVFASFNRTQSSKVAAGHNGEFGEIWWFYCSQEATENDRYVVWNYRENHWTIGALSRTCWQDKGVWSNPIAAKSDGYFYEHEYGFQADAVDRGSDVYLESGPIELGEGDQVYYITQVLHDESGSNDSVQMEFTTRFTPEGSETSYGPYSLDTANGYTDVRASGRQMKVRFEEVTSGNWRLGRFRLDIRPGGRR